MTLTQDRSHYGYSNIPCDVTAWHRAIYLTSQMSRAELRSIERMDYDNLETYASENTLNPTTNEAYHLAGNLLAIACRATMIDLLRKAVSVWRLEQAKLDNQTFYCEERIQLMFDVEEHLSESDLAKYNNADRNVPFSDNHPCLNTDDWS